MKVKNLAKIIILPAILTISCITPLQQTFADDICNNYNISDEIRAASGCSGTSTTVNDLPTVITNILTAIIAIVGLISVVYVVVGGIQYTTSSGDASKIEKAKKTVIYALIGLIVSAISFAIVNFVIRDVLK